MFLEDVQILNFRNIREMRLEFAPGLNVIYGPNAQGKTNLIEAIYMLVTGRSFRARSERELVPWLVEDYEATVIRATVTREGVRDRFLMSFNLTQKYVSVNGEPLRRLGELLGRINAVLFTPAELNLIRGTPQGRRRFMDLCLSQVSHRYLHELQRFDRVLRQRNVLLRLHRERGDLANELAPYNVQLAESGAFIMLTRAKALATLSELANRFFARVSARDEFLQLKYLPSFEIGEEPVAFAALEAGLLEALAKSFREDLLGGATSVGPHRDDFVFLLNERDAKLFGSQGQQRACVLAMKFAEVEYIHNQVGERPILFLDDLMSELDEERRRALLANLPSGTQCFLTTTDLKLVNDALKPERVFRVQEGRAYPQ